MRLGITFFVSGFILMIFGAAMLVPCLLDFADSQNNSAYSFALSSAVTCFFGALFMLAFYDKWDKLSVREMYLTTSLVWILVCAFSGLPFFFAPNPLNYTDSFFETMSGLTTTGVSAYADLSKLSRGILLWRAGLQWFGGLGIIVIALAILPLLRIGGMQLFSTESSDKTGKTMPKTSQIIGTLILVYVVLTIGCILSLYLSGLNMFESVAYSLATIPTGGFSPRNTSAMELSALSQWIIIFFMFISGMPLFYLYFLFTRDWEKIKSNMQVKSYIIFTAVVVIILTWWLKYTYPERTLFNALTAVTFNVISILTTTGFASDDFANWGTFASMVLLCLFPIGGCSGSTAGGIKFFRFDILYLFTVRYLRNKIMPHAVFTVKYDGKILNDDVISGVLVFMTIFFISFLSSTLFLSFLNLDLMTSISAALSGLGNVGAGLGPIIGPTGGFAPLPASAKWLLSWDMMIGRLEYMTVFVLLLPLAWRKEKKNMVTAAF